MKSVSVFFVLQSSSVQNLLDLDSPIEDGAERGARLLHRVASLLEVAEPLLHGLVAQVCQLRLAELHYAKQALGPVLGLAVRERREASSDQGTHLGLVLFPRFAII